MADPERHRGHARGAQCDICGISRGQARGELFRCLLHACTACVSCCSLIGGPYAEPCKDCAWGRTFWLPGHPPTAPLSPDDAILLYA
jgi:hypothetical protein